MKKGTYSKTPDRNPSHEAKTSTESERLEDIRAAADSTIDCQGNTAAGDLRAQSQRVQGCWDTIELAPAVVGDDDAVDAVVDCEFDVGGGAYC